MRVRRPASLLRPGVVKPVIHPRSCPPCNALAHPIKQTRGLAQVKDADGVFNQTWFDRTLPRKEPTPSPGDGINHQPPDKRTLMLGKTIRILHERLPTLLREPLPQDILSPQISLHLFPSTHPHLPTVTGKIPYAAALWTAPVAWGRMPVVGNIKLIIMSERMVKNGGISATYGQRNERLVVRWKTCGKTKGKGIGALYRGISATDAKNGSVDKITEFLGGGPGEQDYKEFQGLFLFEFDDQGRIMSHVIEHAEEGGTWEKLPTVVNVTDWLLGRALGKSQDGIPHGAVLNVCELDGRRRWREGLPERRDR